MLTEAVNSFNNEPKISVRAAAKLFQVPSATLQSRINGKIKWVQK